MTKSTKNTPTVVQETAANTRQVRGQLVHTGTNYSWRPVRGAKLIPLGTSDRHIARARADKLLAEGEYTPTVVDTFRGACITAVARQNIQPRTREDRLSRLRRYVWPSIGHLTVVEITSSQITEILEAAAARGLGAVALGHLRVDISSVFSRLMKGVGAVVKQNPALAECVDTPTVVTDKRKRVLLEDAEFVQFIQCELAPVHLRTMAVVSRCFGGLRNSDLWAWQWEDIDLEGWQWADAPRPKTEHHDESEEHRERIDLPALVVQWIQVWWESAGRPHRGSVFPNRIQNLARDLRRALLVAGVDRPALHYNTDKSLRTDFYSFRRAYVTALANSGMNAQLALRAAGHRSMTTHQKYIVRPHLSVPAAAIPQTTPTVVQENPETTPTVVSFDDALEFFDPTVVHNSVVISDPNVVYNSLRPQRELNPCYRRERPLQREAHINTSCQDESKLSRNAELLASLF